MSEIYIELAKKAPPAAPPPPPNAAAGIPEPAPNDIRPAAPAPTEGKPAATSGKGPANNWGQPVHYHDVKDKPADWDPTRRPTTDAPHGYLRNGDPWSPYGATELRGAIRRKPRPAMQGRDPSAQDGERAGDRRLATSDLKPPANVVGLYAALDDAHKREIELVREIRAHHPETKIGDPVHPKALAGGELMRSDPHFGASTVADYLNGTTGFLARKLGDPGAKPSPKTVQEAADKISEASKYYGISTDPKSAATFAAVVALVACFMPVIIAALGLLIDKIRGVK